MEQDMVVCLDPDTLLFHHRLLGDGASTKEVKCVRSVLTHARASHHVSFKEA